MNGYTKMVKQWKKESEIKYKQEKIESDKRRELEERITASSILSQFFDDIKLRKELEEMAIIKDQLLKSLRKNNPFSYKQYLIIWDIITNNYNQIISDYNNNKINNNDLNITIQYIKNFSNKILNEYWHNELIALTQNKICILYS